MDTKEVINVSSALVLTDFVHLQEKGQLEPKDLATISWRFEAWINAYPLNRNTVLDYFKHSPFYG